MAFLLQEVSDGHVPSWEWLPTTAATYATGDVCVYSSGNLIIVSSGVGQDTDEGTHYVCMGTEALTPTGKLAPFIRCRPNQIWQTTLGEASTNTVAVGLTYGIHTDGKTANSVLTKGCFTLNKIEATTVGSVVSGTLV